MYFPYFRGKREEVFAVREAVPTIRAKGRVRPVFEPVTANPAQLLQCGELLQQSGLPYVLIENPIVGHWKDRHADAVAQIVTPACNQGDACRPALLVQARTRLHEVKAFLDRYPNRPVVLIHTTSFQDTAGLKNLVANAGNVEHHVFRSPGTSQAYQRSFDANKTVLLEDVFVRQVRNADYAQNDDEPFTQAHLNYVADGHAGFGDYLTVGAHYSEGGGPAHAVAIHMTYPEAGGRVAIRHFVSDDVHTTRNVPGKTVEALAKLVEFAAGGAVDLSFSTALPEWRQAHATAKAPTLAHLKRQSLRHHLQLMSSVL